MSKQSKPKWFARTAVNNLGCYGGLLQFLQDKIACTEKFSLKQIFFYACNY